MSEESEKEGGSTEKEPAKKSVRISKKATSKAAVKKTKQKLAAKKESKSGQTDESPKKSEQVIKLVEEKGSSDAETKKPKQNVRRISNKKGDSGNEDEASKEANTSGRRSRGGRRRSNDHSENKKSESSIPVDAEELEKKAWKIYLAEVSEEGLALISRSDAHRMAQRSFEVARAFLEEASKVKKD